MNCYCGKVRMEICFTVFISMVCLFLTMADCYAQVAPGERIRERILQRIQSRTQGNSLERSTLSVKDEKRSIFVNGLERTYIVHLPPGYKQERPYPLVFVLHGGTGNAQNAIRMSRMNPKADQEGFIVVYPNGTPGSKKNRFVWHDRGQRLISKENDVYGYANNVDDVAFFRQLIAQLKNDYNIDPKRIYATGISNGGMMTYRLGCELSDQLAAIAPVAGALNYDKNIPAVSVSVIIFHGTADALVPYNGGVGKAPGGRTRNDKSVAYAVDFWVKRNNCNPVPTKDTFGNITKEQYAGGNADTEVILYTIRGGGHSWPGGLEGIQNGSVGKPTQEISATDLIWDFFSKHPKRN